MQSTPTHHDLNSNSSQKSPERFRILVVDDDEQIRQVIDEWLTSDRIRVDQAGTIAEARQMLEQTPADLVLLDVRLPDGDGLELARELENHRPAPRTIMITGAPSLEQAVEAIRAGAVDFIAKPMDLEELNERVSLALHQKRHDAQRQRKFQRLKRVCKKLNQARHEITQQVDILCNDLVTAYQELATQMHQLELTTEFRQLIQNELDLEQLLRRVLEFMLEKVGPTNAVIFLPDHGGGFAVAGYVNYTCDKETAHMLLEHLADVAAPLIADQGQPLHLADGDAVDAWLGEDSGWLAGSQVLAAPCCDEEDVLASIMLFRDPEEPFEMSHFDLVSAISPTLGSHLVKVISIHHRREDLFGDDDEGHLAA